MYCYLQGFRNHTFVFEGDARTLVFGPTGDGWPTQGQPVNMLEVTGKGLDEQVWHVSVSSAFTTSGVY